MTTSNNSNTVKKSIGTLKIDLGIYQNELKQAEYNLNNFEYTISNDEYDQMLDDTESNVTVCGIEFSPSHILKNLDYTAYRCGKADYEASFDITELEEYKDLEQEIDDLKEHIEYIENKIYELEVEGE